MAEKGGGGGGSGFLGKALTLTVSHSSYLKRFNETDELLDNARGLWSVRPSNVLSE